MSTLALAQVEYSTSGPPQQTTVLLLWRPKFRILRFNLLNTLRRTWKLTNLCTKWWGIFLVCLLFIAAVALMTGALTLNVNLDLVIVNDLTNPMVALILFAAGLFVIFYPLFFTLALPVLFLLSFRSNKSDDAID